MPSKEPRIPADFAFDFLADWRPLGTADVPRTLPDGWTLHGTVTKSGTTYALAWGRGMTAACDGHGRLTMLSASERSRINLAVEFREQSGWDSVPPLPPSDGGFPFLRG